VNDIDVRGKSAFDASSMLQGPKETFVTIKVAANHNKHLYLDYVRTSLYQLFYYCSVYCVTSRLSMVTVVLLSQ
jgi:hypothetical protein